jgi:hypothetical protein
MFVAKKSGRFSQKSFTYIFSLLALLATVVTPLLSAIPVYAGWSADIQLCDVDDQSEIPCIAVWGSTVHVAWQDMRDGNYEVYYKRSTDGGNTWGADIRITNAAGNSKGPSIAVSGTTVIVVWYDSRNGRDEIYFQRSTDGGATWGGNTLLATGSGNSDNPFAAMSGNTIHVAWYDTREGNPEIYYNQSTDGGATWGADTRLTSAAGNSYTPCIAVNGAVIHIAWHDGRDGNEEVYYKRSTDGGATWGADTRLTNVAESSCNTAIAVSGTIVHIAWMDKRSGKWQIYYIRSSDSGVNWGTEARLTNGSANGMYASIVAAGSNVYVGWNDDGIGRDQLYFKQSSDNGSTWAADIRFSNTVRLARYVSLTVCNGIIHAAWQDNSSTFYPDWDIYYKRYLYTDQSVSTGTGTGTATFSVSSGSIESLSATAGTACGVLNGFTFPHGYFSFTINMVPVGSTVTVTITMPANIPPDTQYWKCINGVWVNVTSQIGDNDGDNVLTLTITDGGTGDADGMANGSIVDPGGPAFPVKMGMEDKPKPFLDSSVAPTMPDRITGPRFSVKYLNVQPQQVAINQPVTVYASVANIGDAAGTYAATLKVNGVIEQTRLCTVGAHGAQPVQFTVTKDKPGTYTVDINNQISSFTIATRAGQADSSNTQNLLLVMLGIMILGCITLTALIIKRRSEN